MLCSYGLHAWSVSLARWRCTRSELPESTLKKQRLTSAAATKRGNWRKKFLENLAETGVVTHSARAAGVSKTAVHISRRRDSKFAQAWDRALDSATDRLENEAVRRAVDGVEEPVYQGGKQVGTITRYSDTLLIFLLKANRDKFRQANMPPIVGTQNNLTINSYTVVEDARNVNVSPEEYELPLIDTLRRLPESNGNGHANGNGAS